MSSNNDLRIAAYNSTPEGYMGSYTARHSNPQNPAFSAGGPSLMSIQLNHKQPEQAHASMPAVGAPDQSRIQVTYHDGGASFSSSSDYSAHELSPQASKARGEILIEDSRTRSPKGPGATITGEDIVTIPSVGFPMSVKAAIANGLLPPSFLNGTSSAPQAAQEPRQELQQAPQEKAQEQPQATPEALQDASAEQLVTSIAKGVDGSDQVVALNDIIERHDGELSDGTAARIASSLRLEPYQVREMTNTLVTAFTAQANSAVAQVLGDTVDPEEVWNWARENDPKSLKAGMMNQARTRTTGAYKDLANKYVQQLDQLDHQAVLEAAREAGIPAHLDTRHRVVVLQIAGKALPWATAVRAAWEFHLHQIAALRPAWNPEAQEFETTKSP